MALTWEQTKKLSRMQGVVGELRDAARRASDSHAVKRQAAVRQQLDAVVAQVLELLEEADPTLAAELRGIAETEGGATATEAKVVAVYGWLKGAVEAEALDMRVREEARAYGEARAHEAPG